MDLVHDMPELYLIKTCQKKKKLQRNKTLNIKGDLVHHTDMKKTF